MKNDDKIRKNLEYMIKISGSDIFLQNFKQAEI